MISQFKPSVQYYPVQDGLYAGEYPGNPESMGKAAALSRLRELKEKGVVTFIDLTSAADAELGLMPYDHLLEEIQSEGAPALIHRRFEIPDMGIPASDETMRGVLDLIRSEIAAGRTCYVHCWGGIGRTGTAVGCWLVEQGMTPDEALQTVQRLYGSHMSVEKRARYPVSPQQPGQVNYIRNWERLRER